MWRESFLFSGRDRGDIIREVLRRTNKSDRSVFLINTSMMILTRCSALVKLGGQWTWWDSRYLVLLLCFLSLKGNSDILNKSKGFSGSLGGGELLCIRKTLSSIPTTKKEHLALRMQHSVAYVSIMWKAPSKFYREQQQQQQKDRSQLSIYKFMFCNPRNKKGKIFPNVAEGSISFCFSKMMPKFLKVQIVR